ncbi:hypothetical protein DM02DRAFT_410763 [Periconia macrospinosa]|uniref:Transcription factor TFIIIC triple barrel domain-containing protein n=1 Tax=Periconia macrospinosa TaxID=97972 RepID=A0A2V1DQI3_9PLEO|nr:hypothetical protein DM02DRAFT_410763 [Periconia macrospinosa]
MAPSEEDEWEYEYDEEQTEDFYIPIDLANVPELQAPVTEPTQKFGHPWLLKTKLRAFYANRKEAESLQAQSSTYDPRNPESMGEIQLIGLHTPNPLIMYNGQLLSCHWASAIGTDFLFTNSDSETIGDGKPLRSLPDVDLIATSSARLVARVGQLRPKDEVVEKMDKERQEEQHEEFSVPNPNASDESMDARADTDASQDRRAAGDPAPSNFLARLNAAKAKRGDNSRLMVSNSGNGPRLVADRVVLRRSRYESESDDTVMSGT